VIYIPSKSAEQIPARSAPVAISGGHLLAVKRVLMVGMFAVGLTSSAAGCALDVTAICEASGGTYAGGTCTRSGPSQQAARAGCEASGGVYLGGHETCVLGSGGP
jgi:hypothetical protein